MNFLSPKEASNLERNKFAVKIYRTSKVICDFHRFFIFAIRIKEQYSATTRRGVRSFFLVAS